MISKKITFMGLCFFGMVASTTTAYPPITVGNLSISNYWVRPSTGPNTAAYLTVTNTTKEPDKIVTVDCPDATTVELHNHIEENGIMKMRPVPFIEIGQGSVEMKPGGLHIMLMNLKSSFQGKETIPLTLHFEKAGKVDITFSVKKQVNVPKDKAAGG
jgi:copper(I)-binding protein